MVVKELEILKKGIQFTSFGELYLGLKKNWISINDICELYEEAKLKLLDEEQYIALYLLIDESLHDALLLVKKYLYERENVVISINEDSKNYNNTEINSDYWRVWKLEFLLKVLNNQNEIEEKNEEIYRLFYELNFPKEWSENKIIKNSMNDKNIVLNDSEIYENCIVYINSEIAFYRNKMLNNEYS